MCKLPDEDAKRLVLYFPQVIASTKLQHPIHAIVCCAASMFQPINVSDQMDYKLLTRHQCSVQSKRFDEQLIEIPDQPSHPPRDDITQKPLDNDTLWLPCNVPSTAKFGNVGGDLLRDITSHLKAAATTATRCVSCDAA